MPLNLSLPSDTYSQGSLLPKILVIGVGGAGCNAINNMIRSKINVITSACNTDAQALAESIAENKLQLGPQVTKGLGAGSSPQIGKKAAEESAPEIARFLEDIDMVFITSGMGGGTGTGGAPVIARIAREMGILTVGVVTKPFAFEGPRRMKVASLGLEELQSYVDTLIVIPNQNLFLVADEDTTFSDAFKLADDVLHAGVRGITDLIVMPGLINLDFADIRTVMSEMGQAMMGTGESDGENRAIKAAESAISNPLLDNISMRGAKGVLLNITGGNDLRLSEVNDVANRIGEEIDDDANIIFGSTFDKEMKGKIRVSVVATGIDHRRSGDDDSSSTEDMLFPKKHINTNDMFIAPEPMDPDLPMGKYQLNNPPREADIHNNLSHDEQIPLGYQEPYTIKKKSINSYRKNNNTDVDLLDNYDESDIDIPAFIRRNNKK